MSPRARRLGLAGLALVLAGPASTRAPVTTPADLVLRHVAVIDVTGAPTRRDQRIAITAGRIVTNLPLPDISTTTFAHPTHIRRWTMNRLWTFAMGVGFLAMAMRARRPLVRVPLGLVGVRLLGHSFAPGEAVQDDRAWGHRWPLPHEDDAAAAPGSELPAWW